MNVDLGALAKITFFYKILDTFYLIFTLIMARTRKVLISKNF